MKADQWYPITPQQLKENRWPTGSYFLTLNDDAVELAHVRRQGELCSAYPEDVRAIMLIGRIREVPYPYGRARVEVVDASDWPNEIATEYDADVKDKHCAICDCSATARVFGFPVCEYHRTHGEDGPPCPVCGTPEILPEPNVDDVGNVKFCPDCERPNQFGERCSGCESEHQSFLLEVVQ
jgi:hypothetical protein